MNRYYVASGSDRSGPFTLDELRSATVPLAGQTLVWAQGMTDWARADIVPELEPVLAELASSTSVVTPPPSAPTAPPIPYSSPTSQSSVPGYVGGQNCEDFIILNPALPRMAQAICLYALVVNPAITILSTLSCMSFHRWDDAEAPGGLVFNLLIIIASVWSLAIVVMIAYGGFQLRSMARRGVTWLKVAFALDAGWFVVFTLACVVIGIWQGSTVDPAVGEAATPANQPQTAGEVIDWLLGAVGVVFVMWEIVSLVWLIKRGSRLPLA